MGWHIDKGPPIQFVCDLRAVLRDNLIQDLRDEIALWEKDPTATTRGSTAFQTLTWLRAILAGKSDILSSLE